ncbi:MAG: hypothetical protein EOO40_07175 [Deltaproteobacteria bacterium]|nr:MAG: hypothetical protein EOO40_07175 [Deltaproteobacteria bacterium]
MKNLQGPQISQGGHVQGFPVDRVSMKTTTLAHRTEKVGDVKLDWERQVRSTPAAHTFGAALARMGLLGRMTPTHCYVTPNAPDGWEGPLPTSLWMKTASPAAQPRRSWGFRTALIALRKVLVREKRSAALTGAFSATSYTGDLQRQASDDDLRMLGALSRQAAEVLGRAQGQDAAAANRAMHKMVAQANAWLEHPDPRQQPLGHFTSEPPDKILSTPRRTRYTCLLERVAAATILLPPSMSQVTSSTSATD